MTPKASQKRNAAFGERFVELARRVCEFEAVFSCGGAVDLDAPVELHVGARRVVQVVADRSWVGQGIGKRLMKLCRPAPFGDGSATRHDRDVRDGGQLSAAQSAFRVHGLDLDEHGILAEVHRALCPGDAHAPKAELYALNVYPSGGHFAAHKDTPRDRDMFGTLVVCLPIPFRGGRLLLQHDTTRVYDWQDRTIGIGQQDERYTIHWAAFYGDVDHQIERVTGGTRVTLTWLLRRSTDGGLAKPAAEATEAELGSALVAALEDPTFFPRGGHDRNSMRSFVRRGFLESVATQAAKLVRGRSDGMANGRSEQRIGEQAAHI